MKILIAAEHFDLTPELKNRIEFALLKILNRFPRAENLRLFLKCDARKQFEATLLVHSGHQDVSCTERGLDILTTVQTAKSHLLRRLVGQKERRLDKRKDRTG